MSVEDAVRFLEQPREGIDIDEVSVEDLIERAGAAGFDVTVEDLGAAAERIIEHLRVAGALSDDDLEAISGGLARSRRSSPMASTGFQNFDQKANQMYNLLSSVMKAMNEMRMGTARNML